MTAQTLTGDQTFAIPATGDQLARAAAALTERNLTAHIVDTAADARTLLRELLPRDKEIFTANGQTLKLAGIAEDVDASGEFRSLRARLPHLNGDVRARISAGATPDVVVGSVHAITEDGLMLAASASGSQLGPYGAGAEQAFWVVGAQKVVPDLETALRRIRTYSLPRETERLRTAVGMDSFIGKILIIEREASPAGARSSWSVSRSGSRAQPIPAFFRHRGMSRGRYHRPVLAVAAAAVMLAVTPAAATRTAPPGPAVQAEPRHSDPSPDGPYLTITDGPVLIAELTEDGKHWSVLAFLERHPEGTGWVHRACVAAVPPGAPPNDPTRHPRSAGCAGMSDWPVDAPPSKVHARSPLRADIPGGGPLPGLLLFTTAPEVSRLDVRGAYGEPAKVTQLARTADLALYLADLGASSAGFGYTAWDASGAVIETGIS